MASNTAAELKTRALRIKQLHEAVEEAQADLKAAYDAAASIGFSKKALKAAMKVHRLDGEKRKKWDEAQGELDLYLAQIEGRPEE